MGFGLFDRGEEAENNSEVCVEVLTQSKCRISFVSGQVPFDRIIQVTTFSALITSAPEDMTFSTLIQRCSE